MRTSSLTSALLLFLLAVPAAAKDEPGVPDRRLQKQINKAIENGAKFLRGTQKTSGRIGLVKHTGTEQFPAGTTALGGLALLAAGDRPGDGSEPVDKALTYCQKKWTGGVRTTYDASTMIMFAIEYFRVPAKKKKKKERTEESNRRNPCKLPPDAKAWIEAMAQWLVEQQKPDGAWGYPQHRWDYSNTQYALLGIRAARDCGVKIHPGVFTKVIDHALKMQEPDGPKVNRIEVTPDGREYVIKSNDKARGWGYFEANRNPTGSMTTAGIAILAIANDALLQPVRFKAYKPSKQADVSQAVQDGFAWLDMHFTVTQNPGNNAPNWHYYYLYGLERAAVYGGRDLLGQHDWYIEGAKYLVGAQNPNGCWDTGILGLKEYEGSETAALDTAWAILFLKKATRPLLPIGPPVSGG